MGRRWVEDTMDIDEDGSKVVSEEGEDDENDTEGIKALKVCTPSQVLPFIIIYTLFYRMPLVANT